MSNLYRRNKGLDKPKMQKARREMVFSQEQLNQMLMTIANSTHPFKARDHAIIFLAYRFGLRCGEVGLLTREHFKYIAREIANIPTLKQAARIITHCPKCGRSSRVASTRAGKTTVCYKCHAPYLIPAMLANNPGINNAPPEVSPPMIEDEVIDYVLTFVDTLPTDQKYLFPSKRGGHLSVQHTRAIFNFWLTESGLPPIYSFHSLRHGRGAHVYEVTKDVQAVKEMLRQKSLGAAEKYIHLSAKSLDETRKKLGGAR